MNESEMTIKANIRKALGLSETVKLFNNPAGVGFQGEVMRSANACRDRYVQLKNPRRIEFGLTPGAGDLIGWRKITITPEMVGMQIAQFTSVEVKTATGKLRAGQGNWQYQVNDAGGFAVVARSVEEAKQLFGVK